MKAKAAPPAGPPPEQTFAPTLPASTSSEAHGFVPHYRLVLRGLGIDAPTAEDGRSVAVDAPFLAFLLQGIASLLPFDAAFYARSNPALAGQDAAALHQHFITQGYQQGLLPHPLGFDAACYLEHNRDLAGLWARNGAAGMARHFSQAGRFEGRVAHPQEVDQARRWAVAANATPYRLASRTIEAARIQAFRHPLVAPPPAGFQGGLVLGDSAADHRLRHRRANRAADSFPPNDNPVGLLPGEYVYGGPAYHHFGHVMAELVHRILPSRARFACRQLLFVGTGTRHILAGFDALAPAMQAPLLFLGVEPQEVTLLHDDRVVEILHVSEQGSNLGASPVPPYLDMLGSFTPGRLAELHDGTPAARLLYVSRSRLREGGLILGEAWLEQQLAAEGWHILHPQDHTLVDQMQAYHRAEVVIFSGGSACHGAELFGRDGMNHCVLLPRSPYGNDVYQAVLRPRSRRFEALPDATLLGSLVYHPDTAEPEDHMGVAVLQMAPLRDQLRAWGLARLDAMDEAAYRQRALQDLDAYIALHKSRNALHQAQGLRIVQDSEVAALIARFAETKRA